MKKAIGYNENYIRLSFYILREETINLKGNGMAKEVECNSCGARFHEDLAKCPYCGNLNYSGAEKEYMDKLKDIQLDMRYLKETPEEQIEEEIKKQKKRIKRTVIITTIIVIIVCIALYRKHCEAEERAEYLWQ